MKTDMTETDRNLLAARYVERLVEIMQKKQELTEALAQCKEEAKNDGLNARALTLVAQRCVEDETARKRRIAAENEAERLMQALGLPKHNP
jgi:hypothetical protein